MVPETHGLGTGGLFSVDERREVDAVEFGLLVDSGIGDGKEGWVDVGGERGDRDGFRFEASGPFEEGGDTEAALVNGAFFGAAARAFGDEASVVGGIPKESVLVDF